MSGLEIVTLNQQILRLQVIKGQQELALLRVNGNLEQIFASRSDQVENVYELYANMYRDIQIRGLSNVPFGVPADIATLGILASARDDRSTFYYPEKFALQKDVSGDPFPSGEQYVYNESFHSTTRNLIEEMLKSVEIKMK